MKIRNGFVSNSSSSSYIIAVPKDTPSFEEIPSFYGFKEDLSDDLRIWLQFIIWYAISNNIYSEEDFFGDWFFSEINRELEKKYFDKDDSYFESCEENRKYANHIHFSVGSEGENCINELRLPYDIAYKLDGLSEYIFTKPEVAVGRNGH